MSWFDAYAKTIAEQERMRQGQFLAPQERIAMQADAAYKATVGAGGALWKYITFGFGDIAVERTSTAVARKKLSNILKNDGWNIQEAEGLWRLSKEGEKEKVINPDRVARASAVKSLAELYARYGETPHTMSANDRLAYNIGGSLGTFSRLSGVAAKGTKYLPLGIKGARAVQFGAAGTTTDLIQQLEKNLSDRKPFDFVQAGKRGAWSGLFGLGVGTIEQAAGAWRIHKFLESDAGLKAISQKLTIREKLLLADAAKMGAGIGDANDARKLLRFVRFLEDQGYGGKEGIPYWLLEETIAKAQPTSPAGARMIREAGEAAKRLKVPVPPKSVLEKIIASPRMTAEMWHVKFDKPLARIMSKFQTAAKEAGWKAPTIMDLPASVVEKARDPWAAEPPTSWDHVNPNAIITSMRTNAYTPEQAYSIYKWAAAKNTPTAKNIMDLIEEHYPKAPVDVRTQPTKWRYSKDEMQALLKLPTTSTRLFIDDKTGDIFVDNLKTNWQLNWKTDELVEVEPPSTPAQPAETKTIDLSNAIKRRNIMPNGYLIEGSEGVPATDENLARKINRVVNGDYGLKWKKAALQRMKEGKRANPNADPHEIRTTFSGTSSEMDLRISSWDEGIEQLEDGIKSGEQYIADMKLANKAYNQQSTPAQPAEHPIIKRPSSELGSILKREPTIRESLYHKKATEAAVQANLGGSTLLDEDYLRMAQAEYPHLSEDKQRLAADFLKKQTAINMRKVSRRAAAKSMLATEQLSQAKGFIKPETRKGSRTLFHEKSSRPLALFEQLGDYRPDNIISDTLFWKPSAGRDMQYRFKMGCEDLVREWLKRSGWTNAELDSFSPAIALNPMLATKRPFKLSSGKIVEMYDGTLMDMVMQTTHKNNLQAALDSPFYLGNKKYPPLTKGDISKAYKELVDRYGIEKVQALRDIAFEIGQRGKRFCNAADRRVDGNPRFNVKSYWPIMRAEHPPRFGGRRFRELSRVIEEMGFAQTRAEYSNLPIILGDYFGKLHHTINNASVYGGMLEPATEAKKFMTDRAMRDMIRSKFGPDALDTIDSYVRDMEDISKYHSPITGFLAKRMHKAVISAIGAHAIVAPKQVISGLYLLNYTDIGTFLNVFTSMRMEDAMRLHNLYCPQVANRYRDTRIGRDMYIQANARKAFTDRETIEGDFMLAIRGMDKEVVARQAAGIAVKELEKAGIVEGDPRFGEAFNRLVTRMISESQPAWDSLYRSEIGRSRDLLTRMFTLFHSQREAIMSMGMDAAHKYRVTGDLGPILKTGSLIGTTAVMYAIINYLAKKHVYGKKDYGWKEFLSEEIPINLLSIPFFGEIAAYTYTNVIRGLRGKPVFQTEPMDFIIAAPLEHATKAMVYTIQAAREYANEDLEKGEWKWHKTALRASDEIIQAIAPWYGLPIFPYRAATSLYRQATREPEKEKPIKPKG